MYVFYAFQVLALDLGSIAFLATYKDNLILVRPHKTHREGIVITRELNATCIRNI